MTAKGSGSERPAAADRALLSAFDNAPIGMAVLTPDGVITACNTAVGRLLGRPTDELVGGTFFDFTHADDLSGALANCKQMQAGGSRSCVTSAVSCAPTAHRSGSRSARPGCRTDPTTRRT